ncbi:glycosyltransferase family 4 protein [Avrilella dinanensis]|uniref:Glycosyl transferase family 1 n=1 Tax=Avrilella dinanensis TaxID=2008672 RepID=A0A2M9R7R4_9FLAO|nr:glycosyltransferase family 4 protein [Avrilella dinanensis]PJR04899.1 glycosyl transferase family 1 [Avrilella dinanensis]
MKKVLIITYYWPPAGGPGVQRWLKFVKYLPDFDIEPIVYIPENASYPIIDEELCNEVNLEVEVLTQPIKEPYKIARLFSKKSTQNISSGIIPDEKKQSLSEQLLLFIRGNFFIPDARIGWVKPSVEYLSEYIKINPVDIIITTGPPHSLHLIGKQLKEQFNIPWIADFRDPWTTIGYHKKLKLTNSAAQKHKTLEKEVLNKADRILVTSPSTKKDFEQITQQPIDVITNGYDIEHIEKKPLDKKFTIAHIGSLLSDRNPRVLWKALAELIKNNPDFKQDFELKLAGKVSTQILNTLDEFKLSPYVNNMGYISHQQAITEQRTSQVLLLLEIDSEETRAIIPGKLFEYMAAERPILAIGPEKSDVETLIKQTNTGQYFCYDEKDRIADCIEKMYQQYSENKLKSYGIGLQYFSRKKLTQKLAEIIHQM